jgi:flagellar hook protein FlgE
VDLTQQFSDLIIIQRGYQASSQTTSVANEMIQTLLQMDQHQ